MGVLYVLGGLKDTSKSRELSVEMFDSGSNEWKEKSTIPVNNESQEEVHNAEEEIHYKACFATIHKAVLKNPVNLYPVDNAIVFPNTYPLDSDLSVG